MFESCVSKRYSLISSVSSGYSYSTYLRDLLDQLTVPELEMLMEQPDLIKEIHRIAILSLTDLREQLVEKLGVGVRTKETEEDFEIESYGYYGGAYNSTEYFIDLAENIGVFPRWAKDKNFIVGVGPLTEYKFRETAKRLLLRTVRMNLWVRQIQKKLEEGKKKTVDIQNLQVKGFGL